MNIIIVKRPSGESSNVSFPHRYRLIRGYHVALAPPVPPSRRTWGMTRPERFMSSFEALERKFQYCFETSSGDAGHSLAFFGGHYFYCQSGRRPGQPYRSC